MKIGIDARSLENNTTAQYRGIGRYAAELLEAISQVDHQNEYFLFLSQPSAQPPALNFHKDFRYRYVHGKGAGLRGVKYIRILFIRPRKLAIDKYKLDAFLQLDFVHRVHARRTPLVCVVHDLIPFIFKDLYQQVPLSGHTPGHIIGYSRAKLHWRALEHELQDFRHCSRIISISEHTKQDLLRMVEGLDARKIDVVYEAGGNLPTGQAKPSAAISKLHLDQFLFYVGGADPRKGLVRLAESFEQVWHKFPDAQLVLSGKEIVNPDVPEAVRLKDMVASLSKPKQVFLLGYISDNDLAWFYRHAAAFVFPSRYEGFGLPVLEAMQAGCPVIAYNNSSIPEVAGEAALLVEDGGSFAPAIEKLLATPKLRAELSDLGRQRAQNFSWSKTAQQTIDILMTAAKEQR